MRAFFYELDNNGNEQLPGNRPHGKFTEAELDGIHLVLCNNAEYLIHRCHWEEGYHYEFDESELRKYVNEWQDAVLRNLEARGIDADRITVDYPALGYHYWNGHRNGDNGGIHVATGLIVALPECASKSPHYSPKREPIMRAIYHAACDAHNLITERIERNLRSSLGQKAAQEIGKFLQEVNA
jgi:hypothetical protein